MSGLVTVAFACNDDHGNYTGRTEAAHFVSEEHGDVDLCCQMPRGQALRRDQGDDLTEMVKVGRRRFACHGWREWYGNMAWNATEMTTPEAERLLRYLLGCGYTVEGHDEGSFAAIIEQHESPRRSPRGKRT
jgi:hypothetical protein